MVLVIVLWIVTLLAVMAGGFAYSMRIETRLATSTVERAQARALAEAGVAYAQAWQLDPEASRKLGRRTATGAMVVRRRVGCESSRGRQRLGQSQYRQSELLKPCSRAGVESRDQDRLVDAIQDWRDGSRTPCRTVAPKAAYRPGRPGPKKRHLKALRNCSKSRESPSDIYERIADGVTVFSNHVGVNPELALRRIAASLGFGRADRRRLRRGARRAPPMERCRHRCRRATVKPFFSEPCERLSYDRYGRDGDRNGRGRKGVTDGRAWPPGQEPAGAGLARRALKNGCLETRPKLPLPSWIDPHTA
jgi:hypothetical protein